MPLVHHELEQAQLIVFSDDWGRHPSSCQHLISKLLPRYRTTWVNTIGTRRPGFSAGDIRKVLAKLRQWSMPADRRDLPANLTVLNPRMWPGFRSGIQRRMNANLISRAVHDALGPRSRDRSPRIAITTLPITADLVGKLEVDRWIYYCVDDFSVWPGLDGEVMRRMELEQVQKVDDLIAVSQVLCDRIAQMGRQATLLTHGIDLEHWSAPAGSPPDGAELPNWWPRDGHPVYLFWGLIDPRLEVGWCRAAAVRLPGTLVLVGPQQLGDEGLVLPGRAIVPGPVPYQQLPKLAAAADVLVMPYADLPVSRAMQPLKFKEYLATGKPVVSRRLPATEPWADAADLVDNLETFLDLIQERTRTGVPPMQVEARRRLRAETWADKAAAFEKKLWTHVHAAMK